MSYQKTLIGAICVAVAGVCTATTADAAEHLVYFGTDGEPAEGIYVSRLDLKNGTLSSARLAAKVGQSGFLAIHPDRERLYCVSRIPQTDRADIDRVSAFSIDRTTGELTHLNDQSPGGEYPCHISVDHTGRCVMVANYLSGSVAALPIAEDGALRAVASVMRHEGSSINPQRQKGPYAHLINPDPSNRFALEVILYTLDPATASLARHGAVKLAAGSGPRHLAFHPNGKSTYVMNELLSTITVFAYNGKAGALRELQTISTLPADFDGQNTTAEVQVHPSGKFVYGSNRGHDTIAVFACRADDGKLSFVEHEPIRGKTPRNFAIDPTGAFLIAAGENSSSVAVFRIDLATGALQFTGSEIAVPKPMCVKFLPAP